MKQSNPNCDLAGEFGDWCALISIIVVFITIGYILYA